MSQTSPEAVESRPADSLRSPQSPQSPLSRNIRQLGLFFSGAAFMAASIFITRRSVVRRQIDAFPRFYTHNRYPPRIDSSDRSLLAASALGLATLNVMSFGVMLVGGISWAWDLCSVTELRERSRQAVRGSGKELNPEEEKAIKEMMDGLLSKLGMEFPEEGEKSDVEPTKEDTKP